MLFKRADAVQFSRDLAVDANANANRSSWDSCKNGAADVLREFIRKEFQRYNWMILEFFNIIIIVYFNYPTIENLI